jgi:hypothetical protein
MQRFLMAFWASVLMGGSVAVAQKTKVDLKTLPDTIKSLDWKSVDWNATPPLEQARALMLLDDVLDEMGAQMAAEADLMSQFIDEQGLGAQFAAMAPVEDKHLTQEEAQRVAVAMLRGPMSGSSYATAISDATGNVLTAYVQMYSSTVNREWASAVESRQQMKSLAAFLASSGKMAAFREWAPGEMERQKKDQEAQAAAKRAAAVEQQKQQQAERQQAAQERKEQEAKQRAEEQQAALQMQQAMAAAQASQDSGAAAAPVQYNDSYPDWYYGGLGYATGVWYRDEAYRGAAVARTENRMAGGRGGGGGRRGGGRR